jgi:hypothetical protein
MEVLRIGERVRYMKTLSRASPVVLATLGDGTEIVTDGSRLRITATEMGLYLAALLFPDLDSLGFVDSTMISIPLQAVTDNAEELRQVLSSLRQFTDHLKEPVPPGWALDKHTSWQVKRGRALSSLRGVSGMEYSPRSVDKVLLEPDKLSVKLVDLCAAGNLNPGRPQRCNLPEGLRVDYLLQPNASDLPDHRLQLSLLGAYPSLDTWHQVLSVWPWSVAPYPTPRQQEVEGRFYLCADLPNPGC